MPDDQQKLGVEIDVTKKGQGGTEAAAEINKATAAQGEAGKAADDLGAKQTENAKATEKLSLNHRELLRIFSQLGPVGTEVGHAILGLSETMEGSFLGATLAGVVAVKLIIDYFESLEKKSEDLKKSFEGFDDKMKVWSDAAVHIQEYQKSLTEVLSIEKQIGEALEKQRTERTLLLEMNNKIEQARKIEAEARINAEVAAGHMTPEQAALAKARLDVTTKRDEANRADAAERQNIQDLAHASAQTIAEQIKAQDAAKQAQAAARKRNAEVAGAPSAVKDIEEKLKEIEDKRSGAEQQIALFNGMFRFAPGRDEEIAKQEALLKQLEEQETKLQEAKFRNLDLIPDHNKNAQAETDRINAAAKKAESDALALKAKAEEIQKQADAAMAAHGAHTVTARHEINSESIAALLNFLTQNRGVSLGKSNSGKDINLGGVEDYLMAVNTPLAERTKLQQQIVMEFGRMVESDMNHYSELYRLLMQLIRDRKDAGKMLKDLGDAAHSGFIGFGS